MVIKLLQQSTFRLYAAKALSPFLVTFMTLMFLSASAITVHSSKTEKISIQHRDT